MFGWKANPHFGPFHILSFALIGGGFWVIAAAWRVLYDAQQRRTLAATGPYSYVRHPQYVGFILVMLGFLVQWPTLLTLAMFPVLVVMYVKLARSEEREALASFGDVYRSYMADVPGFIPRWGRVFGPAQHPATAAAAERTVMQPTHASWPLSSILLVMFGVALIGIGMFFLVLRQPLLPEDTRFIGLSLEQLQTEQPRLAIWLLQVFRVLGGYAIAAGVLTVTIAATSFRQHDRVAGLGILIAGVTSIGWMAIINFVIASDFRWILLAIALLWASCVCLFWVERRTADRTNVEASN